MPVDIQKLSRLANKSQITAADKQIIKNAAVQLKTAQSENLKLKSDLKSEAKLKQNPTVKAIIAKEKQKFSSDLKAKDVQMKKAEALQKKEMAGLKKEILVLKDMNKVTKLKNNPEVKKIIAAEKSKLEKTILAKDERIVKLAGDLQVLQTKPISKTKFNQFISESVLDLQRSFDSSSADAGTEIIIRDVEIEASVITELKNNKPIYVVPSRQDMKELGSNHFQTIKYSLSVVPKET